MKLAKAVDFESDVVPAAKYFIGHCVADLDMDGLYDEFPLLQQYVNRNLNQWTLSKMSTEDRWLELLLILNDQHRAELLDSRSIRSCNSWNFDGG